MIRKFLFKLFAVALVSGSAPGLAAEEAAETSSGFDVSMQIQGRTYSPGLSLSGQAGYGAVLRGDTETPWYSFVRPYGTAIISPTVGAGQVGLEMFPVSILGIDIRRSWTRRFANTRGQVCDVVQCQGSLDVSDVSLQSFLGYGEYFSSLRLMRSFYDSFSDRTRPVFDVVSYTLLPPEGGFASSFSWTVGRKVGDGASVAVMVQGTDFHSSGQRQEAQYVLVRNDLGFMGLEDAKAAVGLGRYKSDLSVAEFSIFVSAVYTFEPAIGLGR